jgi:hypothetical protein
MANATTTKTITTYTLELTADEAETVQALCAYTSAKATNGAASSPKKHAKSVYDALTGAGLSWYDNKVSNLVTTRLYGDPGVRFLNYPAGKDNS